jgi:hypothetical protein
MILVASHRNYKEAWESLKVSLVNAGVSLSNVIRVIAGSEEEIYYPSDSPDTPHLIYIPFNFYEMTAVYGLFRFIQFPNLQDPNGYILLHDTCFVGPQFLTASQRFLSVLKERDLDLYHAWDDMRLNILAISLGFIQDHGGFYGINGDKPMAWDAEHGGEYAFRRRVPAERVAAASDKILYGTGRDYYGSGIIRHAVYSPSLDVYKLVANNDADVNPSWEYRVMP